MCRGSGKHLAGLAVTARRRREWKKAFRIDICCRKLDNLKIAQTYRTSKVVLPRFLSLEFKKLIDFFE